MRSILSDLKNFLIQKMPLQLLQTLAIGSFLLVGGIYLGLIDILWWQVLMVLGVCAGFDYYLRVNIDGRSGFPFSAINSGIGICLFLRTDWWPVLLFASLVAIGTKYVFRSGKKHFFNPSYTAIFIMVVLFGDEAYINHFQWGSEWQILIPILLMGLLVTYRAGLLDSVLTFWATLALCLTMVDYFPDDLVWLFLTGSFLIMSFHGFTDPATMPSVRKYRLLFAAQIAVLFFVFRQIINEGYSFFAAYFLVNCFEIYLWRLEGQKWRGYDARWVVQLALTLFLVCLLIGMNVHHYYDTNGVWPRLLTNRCVSLICQWGIEESWDKPESWE